MEEAARLYSTPGPSLFPGSWTAGFTPAEQSGQAGVLKQATGSLPAIAQQAQNAYNFGTGAVLNPDANPYARAHGDAIIRPIYQNLTESILPNIRAGATATGNLGSSRTGISEGLAAGRTSQAAADALGTFYSNAYGQGLNTFSNTLGQTKAVQDAQLAGPTAEADVGAQQRAMEQAKIEEAKTKYAYEQALPYTKLAEYANLVKGPFGGTSESTLEGPPPSTVANVLGGSLGVLALIQQLKQLLK